MMTYVVYQPPKDSGASFCRENSAFTHCRPRNQTPRNSLSASSFLSIIDDHLGRCESFGTRRLRTRRSHYSFSLHTPPGRTRCLLNLPDEVRPRHVTLPRCLTKHLLGRGVSGQTHHLPTFSKVHSYFRWQSAAPSYGDWGG